MRAVAAVGAAVSLVLSLAGCAADSPPEPLPRLDSPAASTPPAPPTADPPPAAGGPAAAYVAWLGALARRDAAASCARHDPELTIELRFEAVLLDRAELGDPCVGFVAVLWEQPEREYAPDGIEVTQQTDEDALLAVEFPGVDQTVWMTRRNGSWFVADTSPRADPASDSGDPARWVARWCEASLGMTRAEVVNVLGPPSGEYTIANGGEPQLYWADRQFDFRAYLDRDDTVLDLVGDYDRLSASDRTSLTCPELR